MAGYLLIQELGNKSKTYLCWINRLLKRSGDKVPTNKCILLFNLLYSLLTYTFCSMAMSSVSK